MPDQPQSVEDLFGILLELSPTERHAFLHRLGEGSPTLQAHLEALLKQHEQAGSFLAESQFHIAARGSGRSDTQGSTQFSPRFQTSQVIAGRFVVVRFIAHGGMGEVYEVEDRLLHGVRVALKVILPEIAGRSGSSRRFQQEVLSARNVVHPNLCPMYEMFECNEPAPPFLFLTMKLLRGETLEMYLKREAGGTREERIEICTGLISGVAAIHVAGVIHRDLKPNNVMLERVAGKLTPLLMDFGLARPHEAEMTADGSGMLAGTPGYLAPELWSNPHPTQASDLYALGVVLHQVLTGERPMTSRDGASGSATPALDRALAPPPLVAAVKGFLSYSAARRCLALETYLATVHSAYLGSRSLAPMTRRRFGITAAACVCVLAGVTEWRYNQIYNLLHPLPRKRFVALLTWPPATDDGARPVVGGLIDVIAEELARAEAYDRNFFVAAQKTVSTIATSAQMNEVREALGANLVLALSGAVTSKQVRVSMHVLDPVSGVTLRTRDLEHAADQLFSLPARAVDTAAELLDVRRNQPEAERNEAGTNNGAALAAFQAAEMYRKQENDTGLNEAIEKYKQALEIDPKYAVAQAKLGWAYLRSYGKHGDSAALVLGRENCEAATTLDPNLVEAHLGLAGALEASGDRSRAFQELSKALSLDPANVRTLLYQAKFYVDVGQHAPAEEIYRKVLKLRPNYWLAHNELGVLLNHQAKYRDALTEFQAASLTAPRNALTFSNTASVYLQMGNVDRAIQNAKFSNALQQNDTACWCLAEAFRIRKEGTDAIAYARKAVMLNSSSCANWIELADTLVTSGFGSESREAFRKGAIVEEDEVRNEPQNALGWMLLALCRSKLGEMDTARICMNKAEATHADDVESQLVKARTLEVLGKRQSAIATIARCLKRGVTPFQVQTMPDLEALRSDPSYTQVIGGTQ